MLGAAFGTGPVLGPGFYADQPLREEWLLDVADRQPALRPLLAAELSRRLITVALGRDDRAGGRLAVQLDRVAS